MIYFLYKIPKDLGLMALCSSRNDYMVFFMGLNKACAIIYLS
jgi:hypothetical protein